MAIFQRGEIWWYEFPFSGRRIRESSKSTSKTLARTAERNRKRELEEGFNNVSDTRHERVRTVGDMAGEYLTAYKLRHPQSAVFADYAVSHVKRIVGSKMFVDCNEATITSYQNERLREGAAPKTVNEEVGFLLRIMDELGDILRVRLIKAKAAEAQGWQVYRQGIFRRRKGSDVRGGEERPFAAHLSRHHARS
jgi:hypothetical protein